MDLALLQEAVRSSISQAEALRKLGRAVVGSNYSWLKRQVAKNNLSTDHWLGQSHGTSGKIYAYKATQVLIENSPFSTGHVKRLILREKLLPYECVACGLEDEWVGKKLVLRLDHKNGVRDDSRLENLRFLCPNCDSQTDTFCGRNKERSRTRVVQGNDSKS